MEAAKPTWAKAAFAKAVTKARNLRRSTRGSTKARQHLSTDDAAIRKGEQCSCELRLVETIDMENYTKFVDGVSELRLRENYGGLLSDMRLFQHKEPNGYVHKPGSGSDLKESLFPTWVPLSEDPAHQPVAKDLQCYMTEVQLQAILDSQGDPSEEINLDMMKDQYGKEISKFSLEAMTVGEDVTIAMRKLFRTFNLRFVGNDSVFPTGSCAPKILTAFRDNPFNFEL